MASEVIVLMGPPGAGKGTQATLLAEAENLRKISTGDMLRVHVSESTELGRKAEAIMKAGDLVPDDLIVAMVRREVESMDEIRMLLDGFPRTPGQAKALDELLAEFGTELSAAVLLEVPEEELVRRLVQRAQEEGRADDDESTVRKRMEVYRTSTRPLIEFYEKRDLLARVNGVGDVDEVTERIQEVLS